jgi:hypothetical protein
MPSSETDDGFSHSSRKTQMATLVVHALKDGESTQLSFTSPVLAVAKGRGLFKTGWMVEIIEEDGSVYKPSDFDQLLAFDRPKRTRESSHEAVLDLLEKVLADHDGHKIKR